MIFSQNHYFTDEIGGSTSPANYRFGGDVNRPESGCAWNGTPIGCSQLSFILMGSKHWQIQVNTRVEGGWGLAYGLSQQVSVRRYDIYREGDWRIDTSSGEAPFGANDRRDGDD